MASQHIAPLAQADQEAEIVLRAPCRVDDEEDDHARLPAKKYQRLSINLSLLKPATPVTPAISSSTSTSPLAMSPSLPSASYSASPSCSAMSTPSLHSPSPKQSDRASSGGMSPILNPFQWTSDLRQYIITDIGPQPTNSQIPALRAHHFLTRQRSFSKLGSSNNSSHNSCAKAYRTLSPSSAATSPGGSGSYSPTSPMESVYPHQEYRSLYGTYSGRLCGRYGSMNDLCTIPQDEPLPPTPITVDRRMLYSDWDDDLTEA
ncbi:hypothetical protein DFQ27_003014 [Actinomortierella ambigua]|uniref:Uncharacterized protein n=1 Tax=Actinomortierella ambigua TaxID=1343610 RepID=A0A9P6QN25_9FUNG|nr:hypothetical protein DFQ27_003014 [Actinomortierella ambigua]